MTGTPDPVQPGGNITYTITVSALGSPTSATLSDSLPAGTITVHEIWTIGFDYRTPLGQSTAKPQQVQVNIGAKF